MSQTDSQIILKQTLYHTSSIDFLKIKIDCQFINQIQSVNRDIIIQNKLHMSLWNYL